VAAVAVNSLGMSAAMSLQPLYLIFQQVLGQNLGQRRLARGAKQHG
jgi:hypothetical protein